MDTLTTPTNDGDVTENEIEETQVEENQEVEETSKAEATNADEYEKAWESIDTDNPSEGLFGDTTVDNEDTVVAEDQSNNEVDELPHVDQNGLLIKNPVLKYKGREIPIDSEEELIALAQKGFKLENEMTKIKPFKAYMNIINDSGISVEDVKAYGDAISGNEQAKQYLAQKLGLQSTSQESSFFEEVDDKKQSVGDYKPEVPEHDPVGEYFASITEESPEVAGKISSVYGELEDEFKMEVYNPQVFPLFATSVANGEFERLYPFTIKERMNNPALTWLQAYQMAGKKYGTQEQQNDVPPKSTSIPKNKSTQRKLNRNTYDSAFEMDTKELEDRLFG